MLSYLAAGMTAQKILADLPYLTEEDIRACLAYAAERERQTLVSQPFDSPQDRPFDSTQDRL